MNMQRNVCGVGQDTSSCQSLKISVLKILNSIDPRALEVPSYVRWAIGMKSNNISKHSSGDSPRDGFTLSADETARYLRIVSQSQAIRRHVDLFAWLSGEVQDFLPHEIFVSAWGDFTSWDLKLDVVSALPGVRTQQLQSHPIDDFLENVHAQWVQGGRRPFVAKTVEVLQSLECSAKPFHASLREMRTMVAHGIRDERSGHESLYVALDRGSCTKGGCKDRFLSVVDSLVPQIDIAFRRIAAYPTAGSTARRGRVGETSGSETRELSAREQEVLGWICQGKTNTQIATALRISPFTVKNHVQRIFKKIDVSNRTQAATKYSGALSELRKYLEVHQNVS